MNRVAVVTLGAFCLLCGCRRGETPSAPVGSAGPPTASSPSKEADLRWAKEVAETFLQAIVDGDTGVALDLGTQTFKQRHYGSSSTQDREANYNARMRLFDECGYNRKLPYKKDPARFDRFRIDRAEIAPDHNEASFRGKLLGPKRSGDFRLVVSKEPQGGKWRVEVFKLAWR